MTPIRPIQQDGHITGKYQIGETIATKVRHCYNTTGAGGVALAGPEGAVAVAQQDTHRSRLRAYGEIDMAVVVEVT